MKENKIMQIVYVAWRERWPDAQWSINIKKVLPRGVTGDVYNLAECLLQQALVGSTANTLVLSYLKHTLCSHYVSHASVIRCIAKYDKVKNCLCIATLLDFLLSIVDGVTCRNKTEEAFLPSAIVHLTHWLLTILAFTAQHYERFGEATTEQFYMLEKYCKFVECFGKNQFLMGILYVGRHEEPKIYAQIHEKYVIIKNVFTKTNFMQNLNKNLEEYLKQFAFIDNKHLELIPLNLQHAEQISYCVQPLLTVEVLMNPCKDTSYYVAELQMLQRLKNYSNTRLFYEIIRAGLISLSNVDKTCYDTIWGAFTFFKKPHIIKQLYALSRSPDEQTPTDYIPEVVEALEMILEDNLLLDHMDTKCSCNVIEFLLNDWTKKSLINDVHVKHFAAQREKSSAVLKEFDTKNQSIINFIIRADAPLSGILKTLSTENNKVQEALVGVLGQALLGNSFELILSVATVEGRLKTFVSRLIQCNENSKQIPGELTKTSRSSLFDISFLMLTFIVQAHGSHEVLPEHGDSFFQRWVRECFIERDKPKNSRKILKMCDDKIVEELLHILSKPDAQLTNSNVTYQDICMNLPGVLHQVLIAWENDRLSSADVKNILEKIKVNMFSYSVCAASYLCAYINAVRETELLKPLNMLQEILAPANYKDRPEISKERSGLAFQIIRKMQQQVHPPSVHNVRGKAVTRALISEAPTIEKFREVWREVAQQGWLPVLAAQSLELILRASGAKWLTTELVEQILRCKYTRDMAKTMDIVFAVLHLDMENCTEALLQYVVPPMILKRQGDDINEPQSLVLARLCVYCIISCLETRSIKSDSQNKRKRSLEDEDVGNSAKQRKIANDLADNTDANDYMNEPHNLYHMNGIGMGMPCTAQLSLREPLLSSVQHVFNVFQQFVSTEELSPKILFVYQFLSLLVECGGERVRPVLKLIPPKLLQNLIKVLATDDIRVGLISRLYDMRSNTGRQTAVNDLCILRNIQLSKLCTNI